MKFFIKLNIVEFFIEIEQYYGEYREEIRPIVFSFIKSLDDYIRAALLNDLILNYPSGFKPPDVYIFNKYLKNAEVEACKLKNNCKNLAKSDNEAIEPCKFSNPLQELAKEYGLQEDEDNLWKKIISKEIEKNKRRK